MKFATFITNLLQKKENRLTVIVFDEDQHVTTADQVELTVKPVFVETDEGLTELRDYTPHTPVTAIQILFIQGEDIHHLDIPRRALDAVVSFLNTKHQKVNMEYMCFDFIYEAAFRDGRTRAKDIDTDWRLRSWSKADRFRPSDAVLLHRSFNGRNTPFAHAAVYIGRGLFLSVYGAGGDFEVSTLENMQRDFNAPFIALATPRYDTTPPTGT